MKKIVLFALLLASCKERKAAVWKGLVSGDEVSCRAVTASSDIYSCVGGGRAYQCIRTTRFDDHSEWSEYDCARVSAMTVFPEEPKSE